MEFNLVKQFETPGNASDLIKSLINEFEGSEKRRKMKLGHDYYESENTKIMERKMYIYTQDDKETACLIEDVYKSNNKLPAAYLKILIDQKVDYSLGKPISFKTKQDKQLKQILEDNIQNTIKKIAKSASKKAIGWGYVYIDKASNFKLKKIKPEQIIPIYSIDNEDEIEIIIRYYSIKIIDNEKNLVESNRVEVWDKEKVTFYQENKQTSEYILIDEEAFGVNPRYHMSEETRYGETTASVEGKGWGKVPFIPLHNNDEENYDLQQTKNYIDVMDFVQSDFANNLEDFQDIYWILKGYNGENLGKFTEEVKRYKALKVSEDGEARAETINIPYEARIAEINNLEDKIYKFGRGVNTSEVGAGNLTNVVIKSRYASLDLKASEFEQETKEFIINLMYFVNKYAEMHNITQIEIEEIIFNRSLIINEIELLGANAGQQGKISEETRLGNHIWISNAEEEMKKIEAETESFIQLTTPTGPPKPPKPPEGDEE